MASLQMKAQDLKNIKSLTSFLQSHPKIEYIRLQWVDYTNTVRCRVFPTSELLKTVSKGSYLGVAHAMYCILRDDYPVKDIFSATGMWDVVPDWASIKPLSCGPGNEKHAAVFCAVKDRGTGSLTSGTHTDVGEVSICPRTVLKKVLKTAEDQCGFKLLLGFETEIIFLEDAPLNSTPPTFVPISQSGHSWSTTRALQSPRASILLDLVITSLRASGIDVQQYHPESADGQYEIVTAPLEGIAAIDALYHTREVIQIVAAANGVRATLHPKMYSHQAGTACHMHFSINPTPASGIDPDSIKARVLQERAVSGILRHLRALCAFTLSQKVSYSRLADQCWAGGKWVCWGSENRETALRRVGKGYGSGAGRWELRCLDGLANMYLALAAVVGAAVEGVLEQDNDVKRDDSFGTLGLKDCAGDPSNLSPEERKALGIVETLPEDLLEALKLWEGESTQGLCKRIGVDAVRRYMRCKESEYEMHSKLGEEELKKWVVDRY